MADTREQKYVVRCNVCDAEHHLPSDDWTRIRSLAEVLTVAPERAMDVARELCEIADPHITGAVAPSEREPDARELIGVATEMLQAITSGRMQSIGGINTTYAPQIDRKHVEGWRAVLAGIGTPPAAVATKEDEHGE